MDGSIPLVVDMDGTLLRSDTLVENWLAVLRRRPLAAIRSPLLLFRGKAHFKAELAALAEIDVTRIPYNAGVLAYLREQRAAGRTLILATASNERIARAVADHIGIFDDIIASTANTNLRGPSKATALQRRFGKQAFSYAGNDGHDLPVWAAAEQAILVEVPSRVRRQIKTPVEKEFPAEFAITRQLMRAMRPHQWVKNLLVFLPLITANAWHDLTAWWATIIAFVALCLVASGIYLLNDLTDLEADRAHPEKKFRPTAAGTLPIQTSLVAGPILILAGLALAFTNGIGLAAGLLAYFFATTIYSLFAKTLPLVDVFFLAFLYALRVIVGGIASGYFPSIWLLTFCIFFFLSLAFAKRYAEVSRKLATEAITRRGYQQGDSQVLLIMGIAASYAAAVILSLYVDSKSAATVWTQPMAIWGFVPLALFWQCRVWLAASRGRLDHDPILYAAKDWVSWLTLASAIAVYVIAA
jgi:4-hydroxybenzoate polyprenyltransferase/phosphoserine phosphatase